VNTAEQIAAALVDRGVRHAFGMPGGATLPLLAALESVGIDFVLVRSETSAGFMADATAQLAGLGVCISTLGPGATNLLSGVTGAWLERSRVLAIAGQCAPELEPIYTHQIIDQLALFRPVTRHADALRLPHAGRQLSLALRHLDAGPPGPVYLELPAEVARASTAVGWREDPPEPITPTPGALLRASEAISRARRPVIFVGCGNLSTAAADSLTALAERLGAPVLTTYRAKGMIPEDHPMSAGAAGLSPVVDAHQQALLAQSDLLIAVGLDPVELRPSWLPGWSEDLPVIGIDRHGQPDLLCPLIADLRGEVPAILDALCPDGGLARWRAEVLDAHRATILEPFLDGPQGPGAVIAAIQRAVPDAIFSLDVGAHRITASHVLTARRPRRILQSNGFSSMGTGLPMAIAAALCSSNPSVAITGDMGLWMAMGELGVIAERELDVTIVYLADRSLSLIEVKQERTERTGGGVRFANPDVVSLAAAFGGTGVTAVGSDEVEEAVSSAVDAGGLQLIEAVIDASHYRQQM
jgi:acetolactate synthase-1/2/3 large subunit